MRKHQTPQQAAPCQKCFHPKHEGTCERCACKQYVGATVIRGDMDPPMKKG